MVESIKAVRLLRCRTSGYEYRQDQSALAKVIESTSLLASDRLVGRIVKDDEWNNRP